MENAVCPWYLKVENVVRIFHRNRRFHDIPIWTYGLERDGQSDSETGRTLCEHKQPY